MRRIASVPAPDGERRNHAYGGVFVVGDLFVYDDRPGLIGIDSSEGEYSPTYVTLADLEHAMDECRRTQPSSSSSEGA